MSLKVKITDIAARAAELQANGLTDKQALYIAIQQAKAGTLPNSASIKPCARTK